MTLEITLAIKPLSTNRAWAGRHYSTVAKRAFEQRLRFMLPYTTVEPAPYYRIAYDFHLVNFHLTDSDNLVKCLQDCLVSRGILADDRLIVHTTIRKFPAKKDRIEIRIQPCQLDTGETNDA